MVIPRMALRLLFLTKLAEELAVGSLTGRFQRRSVVCKNTAHVMQEPCSRQQDGGVFEIVHMVEEKLSVNVALLCR